MTGRVLVAGALVWCLAGAARAATPDGMTARAEQLDTPAELPEPVGKLLDRRAVVVTDGSGSTLLTVWFRDSLPAQATAEQVANGLTYREIPEGTLVGVIEFAKPFTDYRKQEIAAGAYTLRFLVQPDVGDHQGTAPHPEFLLLTPAAKDTDPEPLEPKALIKLSALTTGGDHPGVMLLAPTTCEKEPKIVDNEGLKLLVQQRPVDVDGKKAALGIAVCVAGFSKSR